jgi:hypothetical protein
MCPLIIVFKMNTPSSCVQWSLFFLCFLPPLAECSCKPKVQVQKVLWSHCKLGINSLSHQQRWSLFYDHVQQDRRPTSKIDDLRARSMCVCVILHISSWRYGRIVTLFWCINDDCHLFVCVCVWFCISRHEDMATLQPCSDVSMMIVISVCVWFCILRDMLLWLSLCSIMFCMIYLLTCKAWRTSQRGLAKSNSKSLTNQPVSLRIPDVS